MGVCRFSESARVFSNLRAPEKVMYFPKPRGRPPNNSWWDTSCGRWVKHGAPVQPRVVLATPVATAHRPDTDKEREKRLQEEKELAEKNREDLAAAIIKAGGFELIANMIPGVHLNMISDESN